MILISHRGNTEGARPEKENQPSYLKFAQSLGFDIELDLWHTQGGLFLGHDGPQYKVDETLFTELDPARAWYHAKNAAALVYLKQRPGLHYFWHQEDDYALTSKGYIWVHCFKGRLLKNSICVLPEARKDNRGLKACAGICSDFITKYL